MKIDYIISETTKEATTAALKKVIEKAEKDVFGNFVVIVPETKSIIIEKELLKLSTNGALANVFVYSFVRLVNRLGFVPQEKIVSKQTCVMLLRKIIYENFANLKCYKKTAKTVGFAEKIYDTIQQFKSSNVSVDDLKLGMSKATKALKSKLEDIVLLYSEYESMIQNKYFDDCDKLNLLGTFANESDFVKSSEIFIVGFDNVTYEMTSVLKSLAQNAKSITFSSVYFQENRKDKHIQNNDLFKKFTHIGDELNYAYSPVFVKGRHAGDFKNVKFNLYSTEKESFESDGSIKVFEAKSRRQEIDFIANQILSEVKAGKRFKDIGLYLSNMSEFSELVKKCFDAYEIPYFVNDSHSVSNHVLILFIKTCFELETSHLSVDKVLKFMASPFVKCLDFGLFENFVKETGVCYGGFLKDIEKNPSQDEEEFSKLDEMFKHFQEFYAEFLTKLKNAKNIRDYLQIINFLFERFDVLNVLEEISAFEKENGFVILGEITSGILKKCQDFNLSVENFMGDIEVKTEEFLQIYLSGFDTVKMNLSPVSIDCVVVQDTTDGFYDIKTMFIMGAEDGVFPAKIQDSGIILDAELDETKLITGKIVEPKVSEVNGRELFRTYEALLEPTEKLFVSYSLSSLGGGANEMSRVVKQLLALFNDKIKIKTYSKIPFVSKTCFENKFAIHVNDYLNGKMNLSDLNKEFNVIKNELSEDYKNWLLNLNNSLENFEIKESKELYFTNNKTSISQLETYFDCPYKYFLRYGLRLKENKDAKISGLDVGLIIHRIVEIFVDEIDRFSKLNESEFFAEVEKLTLKTYEEFNVNQKKNKAALLFVFDEAKRLCKYILKEQENSSFKAKKNEFEFKNENAIRINLEDEEICIEGKIDRIDKFQNYIRIIDYKTGNISSDFKSIYYGKKIQLISYLSAVSSEKDSKVAGVFYFPIHSDYVKNDEKIENNYKMRGFLLDDIDVLKHMDNTISFENPESEFVQLKIKTNKDNLKNGLFEINHGNQKCYLSEKDFEKVKTYTEELCKKAIQEIRSGYIEPSPHIDGNNEKTTACGRCDFAGFCGLQKSKFAEGRRCLDEVGLDSFYEEMKEGDDGRNNA